MYTNTLLLNKTKAAVEFGQTRHKDSVSETDVMDVATKFGP